MKADKLKYVDQLIDKDIHLLIKGESLNFGDHELPEFDEYGIYQRVLKRIHGNQKKTIITLLKWACVIVLIIANIGYLSYQYIEKHSTEYQEICTARGEKIIVLLPDGSKVWLNAESKLVYPEHFIGKERKVLLEGEGYFQVAKNINQPFMVQADNMKIRVTGTSFNVSAYPFDKNIITTLDEGAIAIGHFSKKAMMYEMIPGQTAVYEKGGSKCRILSNEFYKDASSWKENRFIFRDTPLEDVLSTLSRHFDVNFEICGAKVATFTYNFVCKANDLGYIMKMMSSITPISFKEISEGKYIVK